MKLLQEFVATPAVMLPPLPSETAEEITARKEQFAELLLRDPENPFKIALIIYPDDTPTALRVAKEWPRDPDVVTLQKALLDDEGEMSFVATKAEQAKLAWRFANDDAFPAMERIKALELTGKLTGSIEKPTAPVIQNNNLTVNKVMVVRDHGTDDEWERKALIQQENLRRLAADVST